MERQVSTPLFVSSDIYDAHNYFKEHCDTVTTSWALLRDLLSRELRLLNRISTLESSLQTAGYQNQQERISYNTLSEQYQQLQRCYTQLSEEYRRLEQSMFGNPRSEAAPCLTTTSQENEPLPAISEWGEERVKTEIGHC